MRNFYNLFIIRNEKLGIRNSASKREQNKFT